MIDLFDFQSRAVNQITERFAKYLDDRPVQGTKKNTKVIPFYQALEAITGAGKTAILASSVENIRPLLSAQPFVLWLSKGRVVVAQTYANLQEGGKYRSLLESYSVRLLPEYRPEFATDDTRAYIFFATVGTFNDRDQAEGGRLIFRSDIDRAELSTWEALKRRENSRQVRRPLLVVYDEAQNLSDQQMDLLLQLEPDAFLLASATMRRPAALESVIENLKRAEWRSEDLVTRVSAAEVAESGLVKNELRMGGYQTPMEATIDDMLADFAKVESAALAEGVELLPKCVYVCKTNIIEGNSLERDDPNRPFAHREAPPILIWQYLVREKGIDPSTIAVYCKLDFKADYPPPQGFRLFRGGDSDYDKFIAGGFRHVIFNLSLQEGWDDPACYFAYVDKSMNSNVQVEQLIGRIIRQPHATRFHNDELNIAHVYVRIDNRNVFAEVVKRVRERLRAEGSVIAFTPYGPGLKPRPQEFAPKIAIEIPMVYRHAADARGPIAELINAFTDYRGSSEENVRGRGARALIQQRGGGSENGEIAWVELPHSNPVSARWVFARAVASRFKLALELCASDDPKFDAQVEIGSRAYLAIERLAADVVEAYFEHVRLQQRAPNPYRVGSISAVPSDLHRFENSLHDGYAKLNPLETTFAEEIDRTGFTWCRNPSQTGYGIPLLSIGRTKDFYPDFLVWRDNDIFAIDTTGPQLIHERTTRKLLSIKPGKRVSTRLFVRLISPGEYDSSVRSVSNAGYTLWRLREDGSIGNRHVGSAQKVVELALTADSTD